MPRLRLKIVGLVQGVGFRPFVFKLARDLDLRGYVRNTPGGVEVEVEGDKTNLFLERLTSERPAVSRIESVDTVELPCCGLEGFFIEASSGGDGSTPVSPDLAVCDDCLRELLDPADRRHLYPFINCTNCGPRYSITTRLPFDRSNTTMASFEMCDACNREYRDPRCRRFHAQADACPCCGPGLSLHVANRRFVHLLGDDPLLSAIRILKAGGIVAVKGLGGFHIACDAADADVVELLRRRKERGNKPFAMMAADLDAVRRFCHVTEEEARLLKSRSRPIVLLRRLAGCSLPDTVAPGAGTLGFMLPYTPLHHLLFFRPSDTPLPHFGCLVMTSGNLPGEPITADNGKAVAKLSGIVDAFLMHDRDIFTRVDDSVVREGSVIRRSRGYVPEAIPLAGKGPEVLAAGADLKNTFTLTRDGSALVSQHIGDMEGHETLLFFEETLEKLRTLYSINPVAVACDMHPGYVSTAWAEAQGMEVFKVQHHHAHVASVMAEAGLEGKVIGIAFDGSGYGPDGTVWGGEFLVADPRGFLRACHFRPLPLPGGEAAIREPWRTALAWLLDVAGGRALDIAGTLGFPDRYGEERVVNVLRLAGLPEFSPLSSGAGRLFDAVAAVTGIAGVNTFEGEAAIALEHRAAAGVDGDYPFDIREGDPLVLDFSGTLLGILEDIAAGRGSPLVAARFHNTVVRAIISVVERLRTLTGIEDVVMSGGVFQNRYVTERVVPGLTDRGFRVYLNRRVPANDGGVSLGQAYILREWLK